MALQNSSERQAEVHVEVVSSVVATWQDGAPGSTAGH